MRGRRIGKARQRGFLLNPFRFGSGGGGGGGDAWTMFKLEVTATNGESYCSVCEMQLADSAGGPNILNPALPTNQSSAYEDRNFSRAIDGQVGGHYATAISNQTISPSTPYWGTVLCPEAHTPVELRLWTQDGNTGRGPKDFKFYGSNDGGGSWDLIATFAGVTGWAGGTSLAVPDKTLSLV